MTGREIIGQIAKERRVEQIIMRITGRDSLTANLKDAAQMVYLALLGYKDEQIVDLWESDAINFLIVRIVANTIKSKNSRYYYIIRLFSIRSTDITDLEFKTEG